MALLPKPPELPGNPGDKIQHMIAFATLGVLAAAGWRDQAAVALFGRPRRLRRRSSKSHRRFPRFTATSQWSDWIADMAAAAIAIGAVRAVLSSRRIARFVAFTAPVEMLNPA